jgi:molybdopterin/thiamine biosynthesis adenylyltransferase
MATSSLRGECVSRQVAVVNWNQPEIEATVALVLGAGGIGSSVAMALARLGVKELILVDKDVVEPSNLNRQILFNAQSLGRTKVEAAAAALIQFHCLPGDRPTVITTFHGDAVDNWSTIVEYASRSTVLFNCIDHGAQFDVAAGALAYSLQIPYVTGSSYSNTWIVEYFKAVPLRWRDQPELGKTLPCVQCSGCCHSVKEKIALEQLHIGRIQQHKSLSQIISRGTDTPTQSVGSHVGVCVTASVMLVNMWLQGSINVPPFPPKEGDPKQAATVVPVTHTWSKFDLSDWSAIAQFSVERDAQCLVCGPLAV